MIDTRVPVVVGFRGGYGAVAIARTLGRLGVPMYLVAHERVSTPVWSSRYWTEKARWDFSLSEEQSLTFLLDLGARIRANHGTRPILLTPEDWVAIFIERNSAQLRDQFVFPQPVQPVIQSLSNKWEMHLLARQHQIPTPATACPASRGDAEEFLDTMGLPIVLKAADRYLVDPPSNKILHSRQELMEEVDRQAARGPLNFVLQEYIPGDADTVWMCNGYFGVHADHAVIFTGKKLRQISTTGIASLAVCLPNQSVATQTRRFMQAIGYRGCVGIGYRYDRRDGLYKLLDVNARVSGVFRLFAGTNEMDVVRVCYLDLTDQHIPETGLRPGRKWMLEDDIVAAMTGLRSGHLSFREWMRSVRGVREWQWFATDDPLPSFAWVRGRIRRGALMAVERMSRAG